MLPGFSDDGESGEELPGEAMVVTGRGIQPSHAGTAVAGSDGGGGAGSEATSGRAADGQQENGGSGMLNDLMVSGVKLRGENSSQGGGQHEDGRGTFGFEFPGFAPASSSGNSNIKEGGVGNNVHDIPFDI